jgi:hypothetical protein
VFCVCVGWRVANGDVYVCMHVCVCVCAFVWMGVGVRRTEMILGEWREEGGEDRWVGDSHISCYSHTHTLSQQRPHTPTNQEEEEEEEEEEDHSCDLHRVIPACRGLRNRRTGE